MSGSEPPKISGRFSNLKPGQLGLVVAVVVIMVLVVMQFGKLSNKKKEADTSLAQQALQASGSVGEPWHPPAFPPEAVQHVAARPPPPPEPQRPAIVANIEQRPVTPLVPKPPPGPVNQQMFSARTEGGGSSPGQPAGVQRGAGASPEGSFGALLKPTETPGFVAERIAKPWATIEQGRVIACNSVTPMTSMLPGFVKAKVTYDVRGRDGTTTLIEHGSDIFGEISHGIVAGQDRFFVLWRNITTPKPYNVRITLNSPAADELGEAGLSGDVDHHYMQRIGGALLLSGIEMTLQAVSAGIREAMSNGNNNNGSSFGGNGLNFYQFQGQGSSLASQLLSHTISIPDTLHKDQALPCSVFAASDLDFSSVYSLRMRP